MTSKLALFTTALLLSSAVAQADVSISNKPTQNMSCDAGVCTATAQKAVLNVGDLQTMLASGDVNVKTGGVTNDIDVDQPLTWANTSRLTLDAQQSVILKKAITVTGTGALTITTNDGGQNGEFAIVPEYGSIQFGDLTSSLVINGGSYALVSDIKTLAADIAANSAGLYALAKPFDAANDGVYTTVPIPTTFFGIFEGLGNAILDLHVSISEQTNQIGLFAIIGSNSVVRDITLRHAKITAEEPYSDVGALAGDNVGTILSSFMTGSVTMTGPYSQIGGLVGWNQGEVTESGASARINAGSGSFVGGLVGSNKTYNAYGAVVIRSFAKGRVVSNSESSVGGIAGNESCSAVCPTIQDSWSTASVEGGDNSAAGGLVGFAWGGSVGNSFATGNVVTGRSSAGNRCHGFAGGLVGFSDLLVAQSYSRGSATGGELTCVGGLLGGLGFKYSGSLAACYSTGKVSGNSGSDVGGLIGRRRKGDVARTYWDIDASGTATGVGLGHSRGARGLTTEEFQSQLPKGFDRKVWGQSPSINNGYPYLLANPPPK